MAHTWYFKEADGNLWSGWQSAETLGVENLSFHYRHLAADTATFDLPGDGLAAALWLYDATIIIRYASTTNIQDGETWLVGRVDTVPRQLSGEAETVRYVVAGGMAWLERRTYEQQWQVVRSSDDATISLYKPRVILGQATDGTRIKTGAQIADALAFAAANGVPLQVAAGMADVGFAIPYDERDTLKIADVIDAMMRWMPDHKLVWDYTTTSGTKWVPTIKLRGPTGNAKTLATTALDGIDLTPRPDLVIPGVRIVYELTHTSNDTTYQSYSLDQAGDQSAEDTVSLSFDLTGERRVYTSQKVETESYGSAPGSLTWWTRWAPWIGKLDPSTTTLSGLTRSGSRSYPRWAVDGAVPSWVGGSEREVWRALITYTIKDSEGEIIEQGQKEVSVELLSTSASSRTYRRLTEFDAGESVPVGVAAGLLASWSVLHYEGEISHTSADIPTSAAFPRPWDHPQLNISGGRAEWTSMAANVQECSVEAATGTITWQVGPCAVLGADDRVALYRAIRSRRYAWSRNARSSASSGGETISGAEGLPTQSVADGDPGALSRLVVRSSTPDHAIDLDPAAIAFANEDHADPQTLRPRELRLISDDQDGIRAARLSQVLASDPYGDDPPDTYDTVKDIQRYDFSQLPTRDWDAAMPGIQFTHPGGHTSGLRANIESGTDAGPRLDMGWGGSGGGNFELYSKNHPTRPGEFRVIYGGKANAGKVLFTRYDGSKWEVVGGFTQDGNFFSGYLAEAAPGETGGATTPNLPTHPFQVYNAGTVIRFAIRDEGVFFLSRDAYASAPTDASLTNLTFALYQDADKVMCKVKDGSGAVKTFALGEGTGSGLPDGTATGQIAYWDNAPDTQQWVFSEATSINKGDIFQWDGTKFIKRTPKQLIRYSSSAKELQVFNGTAWEQMSGGKAVPMY